MSFMSVLAGNQGGRPGSNQALYSSYEATASPISYNSGQASAGGVLSRISKTTTSPTTTQSAWTNLRQVRQAKNSTPFPKITGIK